MTGYRPTLVRSLIASRVLCGVNGSADLRVEGKLIAIGRITRSRLPDWLSWGLRPTRHTIGHFRDVIPSQSLGYVPGQVR